MRLEKRYPIALFKALPDDDGEVRGRFEALVSVFGNVDLQGDRVQPGAFSKSIEKWRAAGDPVPVIFSHDWSNPMSHIGKADPEDIVETAEGLKMSGSLDIDDNPVAMQVYRLLKERRVREWSFAYDVQKERQADDKANDLLELDIIEAGPTLKGANPDTATLGVKSALEQAAKAGRTLSAKNESALRQARDLLDRVLAAVADAGDDDKSSRARGKNVYTYLPGSQEAAREELNRAVQEWGLTAYPPVGESHIWVGVVGTFDDHVVVEVERSGEDRQHFEVPYTRGEDGVVTLGTPVAVDITAAVVPEGTAKAKAVEGKPWHIEERDGKFCVVKDEDDTTVACHDTREEAEAQLRALYASEADADAGGDKDRKQSTADADLKTKLDLLLA